MVALCKKPQRCLNGEYCRWHDRTPKGGTVASADEPEVLEMLAKHWQHSEKLAVRGHGTPQFERQALFLPDLPWIYQQFTRLSPRQQS